MSYFQSRADAVSPIMGACHRQDAAALQRALWAGGDVDAREPGGWTAIHKLLKAGDHREMVSMLLEAGLDVNACSIADCTHLHIAVSHGRVNCVATLLAAGASPTVISSERRTPLDSVTTRKNCRRIVPMLLRAGADMPSLDRLEQDQPIQRLFPYASHFKDETENQQILKNYLKKVFMSGPGPGPGTFATYEKAHRARLTKTFVRLSA
jgi:ankyrin repeat protein